MSRKTRTRRKLAELRAASKPTSLRIAGESEPLELLATEADADGKQKLRKFAMTAYTGGAMRVGFGAPVVVDLAGMSVPRQTAPILMGHDASQIVGHTDKIDASQQRVKLTGVISGVGEAAREVAALAANGFPWQASLGASIEKLEFVEAGQTVKVNGKTFNGPVYVARATTLKEVSFVAIGADSNTSVNVAAKGEDQMNEFEKWLKANGFDPATISDPQKAALQAAFDAANKPKEKKDDKPTVDLKAEGDAVILKIRQDAAAERQRISAISRLCLDSGNPVMKIKASDGTEEEVSIEAHAIAENWDIKDTELAIHRNRRPAPAIAAKSHSRDATIEAMQAACILRARGDLESPAFKSPRAQALKLPAWLRADKNNEQRQKILEAAWRFRSLSMVDLCAEACRLDGKDVPHDRNDMIQAAFSGSSLSNIWTTNVNAVMLATYGEAGDSTAPWTSETEVADFKTNERFSMLKGGPLSKLPPGGEAEHTSRSDQVESYKINRFARQFVVDEQDVIDDAFGALAEVPVEMGNAGARLRPDLVYSIVLSNPTLNATSRALFNATDGNLDTTAALASSTLKAAIAAMLLFQENGVNLNIMATHLLVPPTLKWLAKELLQSAGIVIAGIPGGGLVTERGSMNTLAGEGMAYIAEARLENGVTDPVSGTVNAGSSATWYLASTQARTIEVAYLRGTGRVPQVRSFRLDQGKWGLGWDVKLDIGAKALDWRGLHKATA